MTARLALSLSSYWTRIDGQAALNGVDPLALPLPRLLSLTYAWLTGEADEDELRRFDLRLWRPIPGREVDPDDLGVWSPEEETGALRGLAEALNVRDSGTLIS